MPAELHDNDIRLVPSHGIVKPVQNMFAAMPRVVRKPPRVTDADARVEHLGLNPSRAINAGSRAV